MVVREVIEGLNCGIGRRMEGDAVFTCAIEVFENMEGSFIVLMAGICVVGGKECESGCHVGASASGEPVDAPYNPLIAFRAAFEVRIGWIRRGNRVDRDPGAVRSHIRDRIKFVDGKAMSSVVSKGRLGEED